jgi:hypothetical protein
MNPQKMTRVCAVGLLVGPLMFTIGDVLRRVVDQDAGSSAAGITDAVSDKPGAWLAAALLSALAPVAFLPGVAALVATARGRGSVTTLVGGCLLGLGLLASVGHAVAFYAPYALYDRAGTSDAALKALDSESESYPLLVLLIVLFIAGLVLGTIVLLVGLRMAGRVPVWAVVAGVVFAVAGGSGGVALGIVGVVAALVAFVPAARSLQVSEPVPVR